MISLLTYSTLYPNVMAPRFGIFVEQRLRQLISSGAVNSQVVAPVPWFPWRSPRFGRFARYAQLPYHTERHGIDVHHPRYMTLPGLGMWVSPWLLAQGSQACVTRLVQQRQVQLIDAHYFYPDGVAAVWLGQRLGLPVVITARGTDINLFPQYAIPRRWILWAARNAQAIITVCQALKDQLVALGVNPDKMTVLRNGVDTALFYPEDHQVARSRLGITTKMLLSVGNLVELKGHHLILQAMAEIPRVTLCIVGDGPEKAALQHLSTRLGVGDRVRFIASIPQDELRTYYSAADVLVLASSREGWANVLLEAMACGTPVVATAVGGSPEIVTPDSGGLLCLERSARALQKTLLTLLSSPPSREKVAHFAQQFSWTATTQGQLGLFQQLFRAKIPLK